MPISDFEKLNHRIISPLITPDTQRDAIKLNRDGGNTIKEGDNHCKSTSSTMFCNWLGQNFEPLATLAKMDEYSYNANLIPFTHPGEKIQSWEPHLRFLNQMLINGKIPLEAKFSKFNSNHSAIIYSLLVKRFPIILGTMITSHGHIVLLVGMTSNGDYIIIDPYGKAPNYVIKKADYYVIPSDIFHLWVDNSCNCIYLRDK